MNIEKVLDLGVQLMKNGGKNKSVAFINVLQSVCLYLIYTFQYVRYCQVLCIVLGIFL